MYCLYSWENNPVGLDVQQWLLCYKIYDSCTLSGFADPQICRFYDFPKCPGQVPGDLYRWVYSKAFQSALLVSFSPQLQHWLVHEVSKSLVLLFFHFSVVSMHTFFPMWKNMSLLTCSWWKLVSNHLFVHNIYTHPHFIIVRTNLPKIRTFQSLFYLQM